MMSAAIVTCVLIARINKSNRLFWVLLLSMLAGFVGGSIATQAQTSNKKENISVVCPMQMSTFSVQALPTENEDTLAMAKSAGQDNINTDIVFDTVDFSNNTTNMRDQPYIFDSS